MNQVIPALVAGAVTVVLLYGQLTIDWWQERKKK